MTRALDGWKAIAGHLEVVGVARSVRTVQRWASRGDDPLPIYRAPDGRRVLAAAPHVDLWWSRVTKG